MVLGLIAIPVIVEEISMHSKAPPFESRQLKGFFIFCARVVHFYDDDRHRSWLRQHQQLTVTLEIILLRLFARVSLISLDKECFSGNFLVALTLTKSANY